MCKCTVTITVKAAPERVREGLKAYTMFNWFLRNESYQVKEEEEDIFKAKEKCTKTQSHSTIPSRNWKLVWKCASLG